MLKMLPSLSRNWKALHPTHRKSDEEYAPRSMTHRPACYSESGTSCSAEEQKRTELLRKIATGEYQRIGGDSGYSTTRFCYRKADPLGSGFTSTVYRGWDLSSLEEIAVKVVSKENQRILATDEYYRKLYRLLLSVKHENLLPLRAFMEDDKFYYIVSPVCDGGTLVEYVSDARFRLLPSEVLKRLIAQILAALHELHQLGLIHRDVKLDNILFARPDHQRLQLIDYDMVWRSSSNSHQQQHGPFAVAAQKTSIVGTKDYMAPESFSGKYSPQSDLWSVGIILYIFLEGHFPFAFQSNSLEDRTARDVIRSGYKIRSCVRQKHPEAVKLLSWLLEVDPKRRPSSALEAAHHFWLCPFKSSELRAIRGHSTVDHPTAGTADNASTRPTTGCTTRPSTSEQQQQPETVAVASSGGKSSGLPPLSWPKSRNSPFTPQPLDEALRRTQQQPYATVEKRKIALPFTGAELSYFRSRHSNDLQQQLQSARQYRVKGGEDTPLTQATPTARTPNDQKARLQQQGVCGGLAPFPTLLPAGKTPRGGVHHHVSPLTHHHHHFIMRP